MTGGNRAALSFDPEAMKRKGELSRTKGTKDAGEKGKTPGPWWEKGKGKGHKKK